MALTSSDVQLDDIKDDEDDLFHDELLVTL